MTDIFNRCTIRRWQKDDWQTFRTIRLEALQTNQPVFGASYQNEAAKDDSFWIERLSDAKKAVFGLYDGDTVIGLTGIWPHQDNPDDTAVMVMSFIREAYRGEGLSALLYKARIDWAREQGWVKRILVAHREGNNASRAANQKFGFVSGGSTKEEFGDGAIATEFWYELIL